MTTPQAKAAVRAYKHINQWGQHAALRYVERHDAIKHFAEIVMFEFRRKSRSGGHGR